MNARVVVVFALSLSLTLLTTLVVFAQGPRPSDSPQFTKGYNPSNETNPLRDRDIGKSSSKGASPLGGTRIQPSPKTLTLGQPGLSFRYVQTYGVTETPYFSDTTHINRPSGLFMDSSNNLYVVEEMGYRLLRYNSAGFNTLVIGKPGVSNTDSYGFSQPRDVALDNSGNIWVADGSRVVEYTANGTFVQTLPSTNSWQSGNDNTHFNNVYGVAFDSVGRMFVSDRYNHRVQVYDLTSGSPIYSTTIGTGTPGSGGNQFNSPYRIAVDSSNQLYVVDYGNNRVQRCIFSGGWTCTTFDSGLNQPQGITLDSSGNVYIADPNNSRIRKCTSGGMCGNWVTGDWLYDVAVDSNGNVYGARDYNDIVVKYNGSGSLVGTFVGVEFVPYLTDNYHYNHPRVAIDGSNNIVVIEEYGERLTKLDSSGILLWNVGVPGVQRYDNTHFNNPHGVAVDKSGNVYVADNTRVQFFNASGAYLATLGTGYGTGNYQFGWATGIAVDNSGNIYVSDGNNHRVQIYDSNRIYVATLGVTGVPGSDNSHFNYPIGIEVDAVGNIYVADINNCRVQKFNGSRVYQMTFGTTGSCTDSFSDVSAEDVTVDAQGRVYVSGWNNRVQVFDSSGAYLTTIGGAWGNRSSEFRGASGVAVDSAGNVYVTDFQNARIQKYAPGVPGWMQANINGFGDRANQIVTTLAPFNGQIYAGTANLGGNGAQLWRKSDGGAWSSVITPGFGITRNVGIGHLFTFNNRLYAGTWADTVIGGQVWQSSDGATWNPITLPGFDSTNGMVFRFVSFNNKIYAGTYSFTLTHGTEIWRSDTGDSGSWTRVASNGFNGDAINRVAAGLEVYNGYLYAGTLNYSTGGEIWRTNDGTTWNQVNTNGFGNPDNIAMYAFATFNGSFYVGGNNSNISTQTSTGAQIWRCSVCDGSDWIQVIGNGFGDTKNVAVDVLVVFNGALYALTNNGTTGTEVWRTGNGTAWAQINPNGFGDSNNIGGFYNNAVTIFNNSLYFGTNNSANSGEVWQLLNPLYLPMILRQ